MKRNKYETEINMKRIKYETNLMRNEFMLYFSITH